MQRMISHPMPLPPCRHGHASRHIHDLRAARAGGGHFVECACSATSKHGTYDEALREWCRQQGQRYPANGQGCLPLNVTPMRRNRHVP
ncbi:hypothetical protein [Stenotrophomonas sp. MMGLT7]|uniref:hypothetical protein n=1 Tax=Stenotrophomonas sp. MMGLT7 TaxID=2901227 RepID=UPI001E641508|nr:hypothetical protein [Stenotrophomonas sp. MMGLT7]MCD7096908.1 hypothetical protein [Stenotrophomonas sp. MMGLT7]